MPCNSDYMEATGKERQMSRVACLLDELAGKQWDKSAYDGYHKAVYSQGLGKAQCDAMVDKLCRKCQAIDVTKQSLELQLWWRDHQAADKARIEMELEMAETTRKKSEALSKLTAYERKLLGLS